MKICSL